MSQEQAENKASELGKVAHVHSHLSTFLLKHTPLAPYLAGQSTNHSHEHAHQSKEASEAKKRASKGAGFPKRKVGTK